MRDDENRNLWEEEDWDRVSVVHKWHRKIVGYALAPEIIRAYIIIIIVSLLSEIFFN